MILRNVSSRRCYHQTISREDESKNFILVPAFLNFDNFGFAQFFYLMQNDVEAF